MSEHDAHTIDAGYVHVLTEPGGSMRGQLPTPESPSARGARPRVDPMSRVPERREAVLLLRWRVPEVPHSARCGPAMNRRRLSPEELAAKYAPAPDREHNSRMTAEHHAAADRSGLPQPPRHRGVTLPDGAPERWEVESE